MFTRALPPASLDCILNECNPIRFSIIRCGYETSYDGASRIHRLLLNTKVRYLIHKNLPLDYMLIKFNPVHFNIIRCDYETSYMMEPAGFSACH